MSNFLIERFVVEQANAAFQQIPLEKHAEQLGHKREDVHEIAKIAIGFGQLLRQNNTFFAKDTHVALSEILGDGVSQSEVVRENARRMLLPLVPEALIHRASLIFNADRDGAKVRIARAIPNDIDIMQQGELGLENFLRVTDPNFKPLSFQLTMADYNPAVLEDFFGSGANAYIDTVKKRVDAINGDRDIQVKRFKAYSGTFLQAVAYSNRNPLAEGMPKIEVMGVSTRMDDLVGYKDISIHADRQLLVPVTVFDPQRLPLLVDVSMGAEVWYSLEHSNLDHMINTGNLYGLTEKEAIFERQKADLGEKETEIVNRVIRAYV